MKNLGQITDGKDITTKEYVDARSRVPDITIDTSIEQELPIIADTTNVAHLNDAIQEYTTNGNIPTHIIIDDGTTVAIGTVLNISTDTNHYEIEYTVDNIQNDIYTITPGKFVYDNNAWTLTTYSSTALGDFASKTIYGDTAVNLGRLSGSFKGLNSIAEGNNVTAEGNFSHAEGSSTVAYGTASHAEGSYTKVLGSSAHAEGNNVIATGNYSHAEGRSSASIVITLTGAANATTYTTTNTQGAQVGYCITYNEKTQKITAVVENTSVTLAATLSDTALDNVNCLYHKNGAIGDNSHSEGLNTQAIGNNSHSEGQGTTASGDNSHAEGFYTTAQRRSQHTEGEYNVLDTTGTTSTKGDYVHIVGNGTNNNSRSNAHTLDWSGNAWFSGDVYVGSTSGTNKDAGSKKLITEDEIVGKDVTGTEYEIDEETYTAGTDAEIFNDYRERSTTIDPKYGMELNIGNIAVGDYSHAEGMGTTALGSYSHAEGVSTFATGDYGSHAEGLQSTAAGEGAHAEGENTHANAADSHAEGIDSTTDGNFAHSEGGWTYAGGEASHAEGKHTRANGDSQHVEGRYNIEDNNEDYQCIVGNGYWDEDGNEGEGEEVRSNMHTLDWSGNAWFEGDVYVGSTSGTNKDAGSKKLATEDYVDTYGNVIDTIKVNGTTQTITNKAVDITVPTNNNQLTNGAGYQTASDVSTAIASAVASVYKYKGSVSTYADLPSSGQAVGDVYNIETADSTHDIEAGDNVAWTGSTWDKLGGSIDTSIFALKSIYGDTAINLGRLANTNVGTQSTAEGYNTTASNSYTHAEGDTTIASGNSAHAEGSNTLAQGNQSHAEGDSTIAKGAESHAEGINTLASSDYSHAEGWYTISRALGSHSEGGQTITMGRYAHAEGGDIYTQRLSISGEAGATTYTTSSTTGVKIGYYLRYKTNVAKITNFVANTSVTVQSTLSNIAITDASVDILSIVAEGHGSHAEGYGTIATGNYSHAEGWNTEASGDYGSHAEGSNGTKATAQSAHAEGAGTTASGNYGSHSEGQGTTASGSASHSEGSFTTASGNQSHAENSETTASGQYSHSEGKGTTAQRKSQHTEGEYNILDTTGADGTVKGSYIHITGNGTGSLARSNAYTLDWSGNGWFAGDVYVGSTSGTNKDAGSKKLATEEYVDTHTLSASEIDVTSPADTEGMLRSVSTTNEVNLVDYVNSPGTYTIPTECYIYTDSTKSTDNKLYAVTGDVITVQPQEDDGTTVTTAFTLFSKVISTGEMASTDNTTWTSNINHYANASDLIGENLTGNQYVIDEDTYTAGDGAERFNDYRVRGTMIDQKYQMELKTGNITVGDYAHTEGMGNNAIGDYSHAEGCNTISNGDYGSHAEGLQTQANGESAHAEGEATQANAVDSHAEGINTQANANFAHAEGQDTRANGQASHVEGEGCVTDGVDAHAEGRGSYAYNVAGHAEGDHTIANGQHAEGRYNIEDEDGNYAHVVGNGYWDEDANDGEGEEVRSNAYTLDWSGNGWFAGTLKIGGTSYANANTVATENYVSSNYIAEPATEGTSGQVLTTDGNGGRTWTTVQGGGGGTSDYSQLTNKPSINSVTLTGNKSLSDLGIAAANNVINATDLTVTNNAVNLVSYVTTPGIYKVPSNCYIYTDSASSTANRVYAQTGDIVQIEPQIENDDGEGNITYDTWFTLYGSQIRKGVITTTDNSTWTSSLTMCEMQSNKVTTIAASSNNLRYPSARAVYDFVNTFVSDNTLRKTNTTAFTPTSNYHPATKKYVDDSITDVEEYVEQLTRDGVRKTILYNGKANDTAILSDNIQQLSDSIFNYDLIVVGFNCLVQNAGRSMEICDCIYPNSNLITWCDTTGAGATGAHHIFNSNQAFNNCYRIIWGFTDATHIRNIVSAHVATGTYGWVDEGICYVVGYKFSALPEGYMEEPTTEGTSGQVLTTDGQGGRTWTTVSGGGGTSDYTQLSNKPQINSVTLTGNVSLSTLGAASEQYVDNKITYGTSDLTAGTSQLTTGTLYFVYE